MRSSGSPWPVISKLSVTSPTWTSGMEHLVEQRGSDVSPGKYDDGLATVVTGGDQAGPDGCHRHRPRTFEDQAHLVGGEGHGRPYVGLAHRQNLDVVVERDAHRDRPRLEIAGQAIGKCRLHRDGNDGSRG